MRLPRALKRLEHASCLQTLQQDGSCCTLAAGQECGVEERRDVAWLTSREVDVQVGRVEDIARLVLLRV